MKILILNGPNLNLIGKREPEIYGNLSFDEFIPQLRERFPEHEIGYFQSNHEHTSIALADCIRAIGIPVIEVHISDISKREPYRQHSYSGEACAKSIMGLGMEGYAKAIEALS